MNNFGTGMIAGIIIGSAVVMMQGGRSNKTAVKIKRTSEKHLKQLEMSWTASAKIYLKNV
jgi:gas vesicle protein